MKIVSVSKNKKFDIQDYIKRSALDSDYNTFFKQDVTLVDKETKKLVAVYFTLPSRPEHVVDALTKIQYFSDVRTEGLKTRSRIFGYRPRETIRKDFCSSTSLASHSPREHAILAEFGTVLTKYYKKYCGDVYKEHEKLTDEKVLPDWKIKGTPFTSGIVNKNNPLKYHFDSGNFENVYSNMVAFKKFVAGGHLAIPEYDLGLEIADNSVLLFDGQKLLHGVTPIRYQGNDAYRYTIVYYTLKKMWNCQTITEEIARVRKVKTAREFKRYDRMVGIAPKDKL